MTDKILLTAAYLIVLPILLISASLAGALSYLHEVLTGYVRAMKEIWTG